MSNQPDDSTVTPSIDSIREIEGLFYWGRMATRIIGGLLAVFFTFLQLKDFPPGIVLEKTNAQFFIQLALITYYFSWFFAPGVDFATQQAVYVRDPNRGRIPKALFVGIPLLVCAAAILLWASRDERYLAIALAVFFIVDIFGWLQFIHWARPVIKTNKEIYADKYFELERVNLVEAFICGYWALYRFVAMLIMIVVINATVFDSSIRQSVSAWMTLRFSGVSETTISDQLPGILFLLYVLIAEGWIWIMRVKTRVSLQVVSSLRVKYIAVPR